MDIGDPVQIYLPEDAGEAEEILVLDPAGAAALVDLHRQTVVGLLYERCHLKLRGGKAVLAVAHEMPIEPYIEGCLHALEGQEHRLSSSSSARSNRRT